MKSLIAEAIGMEHAPVAILWTDEKPEGALQFKPGRWGCVMFLLANAARGRSAVADRETFGCIGGGVGLGFGDMYKQFPGGIAEYISTGNPEFCATELGRRIAGQMPELEHGERYVKCVEESRKFFDVLPITDIPTKFVALKPLDMTTEKENPKAIVFVVDADQLSALVVLAHYATGGRERVYAPFGAGCHQIGIFPYREAHADMPRAVIGLTDISARKNTMKMLGHNVLTLAVPFKMFQEMESNVPGSFLERPSWRAVFEDRKKNKD